MVHGGKVYRDSLRRENRTDDTAKAICAIPDISDTFNPAR